MSHLDRILHDGVDREGWLAARIPVIGASDAAGLSKPESVDKYLAAKLAHRDWSGNDYTASGHRWEPMMLAWAGIPENKALIHSPQERGFAATPDGVTADSTRIAECKAKHNKVVDGPTLGEWRQVAWQFLVVPEAETCEWIWVELIDGELRQALNGEPKSLTIHRDDPKIVDLITAMLPIATDLLARLTHALEFEREMNAA
jgi:hypothetical protein